MHSFNLGARLFSRNVALLLLWLCGVACSPSDAAERTLFFTAIPDSNTTELSAKFQPVAEFLSRELGVPVEYVPTASYSASVEMFKNGDVQLAWFGGLTGVQARAAVEGSRAIAQGAVDPEFKSYFIASAESGLQPSDSFPAELEGKRFAFGSESSTSGRLMPEHFIREFSGRAPEDFFGAPNQFAGSHDQTAILVQAGTFDAGALSYKAYDSLVAKGAIDPESCRVIWTTPTYPDYNWTAHPLLDQVYGPGTIERVQTAIIQMETPELLRAVMREEGLIKADNDDFAPIATLARALGFLE